MYSEKLIDLLIFTIEAKRDVAYYKNVNNENLSDRRFNDGQEKAFSEVNTE